MLTGEPYTTAEFPTAAYNAWKGGEMIQDALHMLSADDREFIMSGISPAGWDTYADELDEIQQGEYEG